MHEQKTERYFELALNNCGAIILNVGVIAIVGWITGIHLLTRISPKFIPMAPDTALAFVIFGILLLTYYQRSARRLPRALMFWLPGIIGVYGLLKATEYLLGADLTFANILFPEKQFLGPYVVGRMSPVTGALFFLAGTGMTLTLVEHYRRPMRMVAGWIGVAIASIGFLTTYAYVLGTPFFYKSTIIPLAAPTAFAFCFLGAGLIVAAGPDAVLKPFVGSSPRSRTLRAFVPLAIVTCFAQEVLHDFLMDAIDVPHALVSLYVALVVALIAAITGERLAQYLSNRLQVAEHLLQQSEEKYRSMIEQAHDLIWALDRQGNFTFFNRRCEEVSGYKLPEWVGRSFVPMLNPEDVPRIQDILTRALNGEPQEFEVAVYRADGSHFVLDVTCAPEYTSGEVIGVVCFGKDITERKRVEQLLEQENLRVRESERRLREAEQLAHLGNWEFDLVSNSLHWSDEIYRIFDLAPQKFGATYQAFLDAIHPDDRDDVNKAYIDSVARKTAYDIEHRLLMKDGRVKYVREYCQTFYDDDGRALRSVGTVQDITERKRAEEEQQQSLSLLEATLESTADGILVVDAEGRVTAYNHRFLELWRIPEDLARLKDDEKLLSFVLNQLVDSDGFLSKVRDLYAHPLEESFDLLEFHDGRCFERLSRPQVINQEVVGRVWSFRDITEGKQTEEKLRESAREMEYSRNVLLQIIESIPVRVFWKDRDSKYLGCNTSFAQDAGFDRYEELLEKTDYEMGWKDQAELYRADDQKVMRSGRSKLNIVEPQTTPTGETIWLNTSKVPLRSSTGDVLGVLGLYEDITNRMRAEQALRDSEERFRQVIESAGEWIWEVDVQGLYRHVSPVVEKVLGYTPEELEGKVHFYDLFAPEARDELKASALSTFARKESFRGFVSPNIHKNGSVVVFETNGVPILDATGALLGYRGADLDVTERKRAEQALHESEELLRSSQSVARLGSYNLDISAGTWSSSPAMDDLLGIDDQFARTVDGWLSLIHPEWRETVAQYFATEVLGKGKRFDKEYKIIRKADGQECWVHGLGDLTFDDQGRLVRMIGTIQNISDRKLAEAERVKLEAQLRQAQKLETIGTLAGGIAHDFNNILTPIMAYTEMAAKRLGEGHPQRHDLEHVIAGANRAKDLVKQILSFSRQMEGEKIEIELAPIVKEAIKLLQASLPSTIEIQVNIQTGCGEVLADPSQIHQVLMNLCTNAFHAMREHGGELAVNLESVTLTEKAARMIPALSAGEYVRLSVTDSGCGMDQGTQDRIFEPFFTTKRVGEGTGLGLSVVHGIVRSHGGAINVHSEVEKGTVFEVYLPQIGATQRSRIVESIAVVGGDEYILVVDDEPEVASVISDVLEEMFGYTVTVRTSSVEALELLRVQPNRFDLVITDLTMPHLSGDHLAREIQAIRKDLPVILMTGFSETINEERCRQLGIAGFLLKPPLSADLARLVRSVLDGVPTA